MNDRNKKEFVTVKKHNRQEKKKEKRGISGEEVIYIFEKVLEGWKTIKIYNTMIQIHPSSSSIHKKLVETIATGNCLVCENELTKERYDYYKQLREQVYQYQGKGKNEV